MSNIMTIIRKELRCLAGGGKGMFIIYTVISLIWSLALLSNADSGGMTGTAGSAFAANSLWFVFFSVIVTANFSSSTLISERVNGTLEILITSGLSRDSVLFGKTLFIFMMTMAMGAACAILAAVWAAILPDAERSSALGVYDALLYAAAAILSTAASAYLSVRMSNPRFLHFINLFMIAAFAGIYGAASEVAREMTGTGLHPSILALGFLLTGAIFMLLARREFGGERITRPVVF